jgi:hypothetical protein
MIGEYLLSGVNDTEESIAYYTYLFEFKIKVEKLSNTEAEA